MHTPLAAVAIRLVSLPRAIWRCLASCPETLAITDAPTQPYIRIFHISPLYGRIALCLACSSLEVWRSRGTEVTSTAAVAEL